MPQLTLIPQEEAEKDILSLVRSGRCGRCRYSHVDVGSTWCEKLKRTITRKLVYCSEFEPKPEGEP